MPFKIIRNDITKVKADAIVNTANLHPICASGTDLAIYEAAGIEQVLEERRKIGKIARGEVAAMEEIEDGEICAISKTYKGETNYILFNLGKEEKTVTVSKDTYNYEGLAASLAVDENEVSMKGETVTLPAYGVAVIK